MPISAKTAAALLKMLRCFSSKSLARVRAMLSLSSFFAGRIRPDRGG
ncbi:hypothetical protein [Rhizobium setariae]|nr:hypothetical protein [Rhizobium setariae]